ncbi:MAG: DsrE family protein [Gammaproteobacteria bacterium]|nr:DsrE family protein [Gammaproteobacteria bacterium]
MRFIKSLSILVLMALSLTAINAQAGDFAEKKIVLQVSDADKQGFVLNVASNLVKHYGKDQVEVEVVAFGPGMGLLVDGKKNKNKDRVSSLAAEGVKFSACGNTIKKMTKKNKGVAPKIMAQATVAPAGVVRIIELQDKGYKLIKP